MHWDMRIVFLSFNQSPPMLNLACQSSQKDQKQQKAISKLLLSKWLFITGPLV